jgi:hypothetical protein
MPIETGELAEAALLARQKPTDMRRHRSETNDSKELVEVKGTAQVAKLIFGRTCF